MKRHGLRDDQFARIENLLPGRPGTVGRDSDRGNRLFVEAVIWKFRVGAPWRDLPQRFGGWSNTHRRFSRWAEKGAWEDLFNALAEDLVALVEPKALLADKAYAADSFVESLKVRAIKPVIPPKSNRKVKRD